MSTPVKKLISDADAILAGSYADPLLDWRDAAKMYETAGQYGSGEGFSKLALMYRAIGDKKYFKLDNEKAIELYKKAVSLKYYDCLPDMAGTYIYLDEIDNYLKIWDLYLDKTQELEGKADPSAYVKHCIRNDLTYEINPKIKAYEKVVINNIEKMILSIIETVDNLEEEIKEFKISEIDDKEDYFGISEQELLDDLNESKNFLNDSQKMLKEANLIFSSL